MEHYSLKSRCVRKERLSFYHETAEPVSAGTGSGSAALIGTHRTSLLESVVGSKSLFPSFT